MKKYVGVLVRQYQDFDPVVTKIELFEYDPQRFDDEDSAERYFTEEMESHKQDFIKRFPEFVKARWTIHVEAVF